jgi:nicotinamidase-related amidase
MEKFFLERADAALLIIDIQEKLAAVMESKDRVVKNCLHLIELAKLTGMPVLVTEQYPKGLGQTVEEIRNAVPLYQPAEKIYFNCCEEPSCFHHIKTLGRKTLIMTGMETHICILQTCLGLLRNLFHVHVASDAVCSRLEENRQTALQTMRQAGAVISSTESILFQILSYAGTDDFKTISKRIR